MIRRPPRSTQSRSSAASDVYKRQSLQIPLVHCHRLFWNTFKRYIFLFQKARKRAEVPAIVANRPPAEIIILQIKQILVLLWDCIVWQKHYLDLPCIDRNIRSDNINKSFRYAIFVPSRFTMRDRAQRMKKMPGYSHKPCYYSIDSTDSRCKKKIKADMKNTEEYPSKNSFRYSYKIILTHDYELNLNAPQALPLLPLL